MVGKMVYRSAVSLDGRRVDLKVAASVSSMDIHSAGLSAVETVLTQAEVKADWTAVYVAAW